MPKRGFVFAQCSGGPLPLFNASIDALTAASTGPAFVTHAASNGDEYHSAWNRPVLA
jgi:hypothetical protein